MKRFAILMCVLLLPTLGWSATYHVRTNGTAGSCIANTNTVAGSQSTIQAGANCATAAGDIVSVHVGSYTEAVSLTHSGSSGNPIIIQNFGYTGTFGSGEVVTWKSPSTDVNETVGISAIYATDKSYLRIQGFTFQAGRSRSAIFMWNSNYRAGPTYVVGIEILNNTFDDNGTDAATSAKMTRVLHLSAIGRENGYAGTTPLNFVNGNTFTNNYGANVGLVDGSSDVEVANNTITGTKGSKEFDLGNNYAAHGVSYSGARMLIHDNTMSAWDTSVTSPLDFAGVRCDVGGNAPGNIIRNNTIHDLHYGLTTDQFVYGILLEAECGGGVNVHHNIIYNIGYSCITVGFSGVTISDGGTIEHNTGYQCKRNGLNLGHTTNFLVRNNIFAENAARGGAQVMVADCANGVSQPPDTCNGETFGGGHTFRNNLYFMTGNSLIGKWGGNDIGLPSADLTLSAWNSTSGEAGSVPGNPLFVNPPSDLHLQSTSPARGAGTDSLDLGAYDGPPAPDFTFNATSPVTSGNKSTITWSAPTIVSGSVSSCTASATPSDALWGGGVPTSATLLAGNQSGTYQGSALTATITYHMACTSNLGVTKTIDQIVTVTSTGSVLHWGLDEDASSATTADSSGNLRTGTLNGGVVWVTPGKFGAAEIQCDGVNDYVSAASTPLTATNNWTIAAWISPASLTQLGIAVLNGVDDGTCASGCGGYGFGLGDGAGGSGAKLTGIFPGLAWYDSGYTFPAANVWHHVVMLRDQGTTKFYVDSTQTANTSATVPTAPPGFRVCSQTGVRFFNGKVDEVWVFDRALSQSEINNLYDHNAVTPSGTVVEYFPLYCTRNGGLPTQVTNVPGALGMIIDNDSAVNMGDTTSVLLPDGGFTHVGGRFVADTIDPNFRTSLPTGGQAEWEYRVKLVPPAAPGDVYACSPRRENGAAFDSYANVTTVTVTNPQNVRNISGVTIKGITTK